MSNHWFLTWMCLLVTLGTTHSQLISLDNAQICPEIRPGEDDLPGFDFISNYGLDGVRALPGVRKVEGTNPFQKAYRIDETARLRIRTTDLFPKGLPEQFSFVSTFRMLENTRRERWNLFQIRDFTGQPQFGVLLDGKRRTVELYFVNLSGRVERLVFNRKSRRLFNNDWHKIHFSVTRDNIEMYIDCNPIASQPLPPRRQVDLNGEIRMGTIDETGRTTPFELQWMLLDCDPSKPERENCDELPRKEESTGNLTTTRLTIRPRTTPSPRPSSSPRPSRRPTPSTPDRPGSVSRPVPRPSEDTDEQVCSLEIGVISIPLS